MLKIDKTNLIVFFQSSTVKKLENSCFLGNVYIRYIFALKTQIRFIAKVRVIQKNGNPKIMFALRENARCLKSKQTKIFGKKRT